MMKLLIAYASKSGCAREMATLLKEQLPRHEVTLCDLAKEQPDPAAFDYAVVGGSIRMNKAHKAMRAYMEKHGDALKSCPHTLFLCCAFAEHLDHYFGVAFPREILESAEERVYFGGDLSLSRQRGLDKLLTRMIRNSILESEEEDAVLPTLLPEHVRALADRLRKK
jgi:menaquinone-dependent protoporphyrinogen IX oxidase